MLAAINPVALPALPIAATFSLSSTYSAAHTSFEIATVSLTEIQTGTTTFRPSAS
jgi:hypothetical protein